jgi:hypothetical protein
MGNVVRHPRRYQQYLDQLIAVVRGRQPSVSRQSTGASYSALPINAAQVARTVTPPPPVAAVVKATAQHPPATDSLSALERHYPDIIRTMVLLWGYPEMNTYFNGLWSPEHSVRPIAPDAMSELMVLARIHHRLVPDTAQRSSDGGDPRFRFFEHDIWSDVPPHR